MIIDKIIKNISHLSSLFVDLRKEEGLTPKDLNWQVVFKQLEELRPYVEYTKLDLKRRELCASNCASLEDDITKTYRKLDELTIQIMGKDWEKNPTFP